jgi:predicted kinase
MHKQKWLIPPNDCSVDQHALNAALKNAYNELTAKHHPVRGQNQVPEFILTIGAPGAGKHTISKIYIEQFGKYPADNYVTLDFDAAIKYHPDFNNIWDISTAYNTTAPGVAFTTTWKTCNSKLSSMLWDLAEKLMDRGFNIIMQSHEQKRLVNAKMHGYNTILLFVGAPLAISIERAQQRAISTGKFLEPTLEAQKELIDNKWTTYRYYAPYYAMWADELVVVSNHKPDVNNAKFKNINPHDASLGNTWDEKRESIQRYIDKAIHWSSY